MLQDCSRNSARLVNFCTGGGRVERGETAKETRTVVKDIWKLGAGFGNGIISSWFG